jgi:hypothetical protein
MYRHLCLHYVCSYGPFPEQKYATAKHNYIVLNLLFLECKKAIPVTGREGPSGCERSRLPHLLDNRLTDGGKVVSLTHWPRFTPQEDSWYSFLLEAELTPGP